MIPLDPNALARFQLDCDRAATASVDGLFEHKLERMSASPLAFLRGAAPLYYRILKARRELAVGPKGKGWLTGDMHLENFGAYRPNHATAVDAEGRASHAVFDLNDFDDAVIGPFYLDVLRLTTSLILGGRELGADGVRVLELAHVLLDAYVKTLSGGKVSRTMPPPIARLIAQAKDRPQGELLDARTEGEGERRRFQQIPRYPRLPPKLAKAARAAFAKYVTTIHKDERPDDLSCFEVLDIARRVAGTGSLGCLRIAVLVRGKGGRDGQWIFDLKEEGTPSASVLLGQPLLDPAVRVLTAERATLEHPPRMLGMGKLDGKSLFGRRLAPQEDKLDLRHLADKDLAPLAAALGQLLGRAHRHGATKLPKKPWSEGAREHIVDNAITLAGIHEAVYLSICKEVKVRR
jgi:uncharacterized protein (DUF2252 family)